MEKWEKAINYFFMDSDKKNRKEHLKAKIINKKGNWVLFQWETGFGKDVIKAVIHKRTLLTYCWCINEKYIGQSDFNRVPIDESWNKFWKEIKLSPHLPAKLLNEIKLDLI